MVGYFVDRGASQLSPSRPMVVKYGTVADGRDKLQEEKVAAETLKQHVYVGHDHFAFPFRCDPATRQHRYSVLWSPFSTSQTVTEVVRPSELQLRYVKDLLHLLRGPQARVHGVEVLQKTYSLLEQLHRSGDPAGISVRRQLYEEYAWYLRNVDRPDGWGQQWREIWGRRRTASDFGTTWSNPFSVLKSIENLPPAALSCGVIHGDLHPRNVILSASYDPFLIDYGWSQSDKHVAKDFALLECNLRFVTLPPDVPNEHLLKMAGWLSMSDRMPGLGHATCTARCQLIRVVRESFRSLVRRPRVDAALHWIVEYEIPLFLVAFGLLQHIRDYDNQLAARMTVLSLATHLDARLPELEQWLRGGRGAAA